MIKMSPSSQSASKSMMDADKKDEPQKITMLANIEDEFEAIYQNEFVVYLDSAGRSVLPKIAASAGIASVKQKTAPWLMETNGTVGDNTDSVLEVRNLFAWLIDSEENTDGSIAICPSTAFAMTMAVHNVVSGGYLREGKKILVLEKEMGSVIYPWQSACRATGAEFLVVSDPLRESITISWTDRIISLLEENFDSIAVIALPPVHWCDGSLIELEKIRKAIDSLGSSKALASVHSDDGGDVGSSSASAVEYATKSPLLIVDGTQAVGAFPISVRRIRPTFLACSTHKWLNGPYGMSLVYLAPAFQHTWLPLDQHDRARLGCDRARWDEEVMMNLESGCCPEEFQPGARRLDAGGKINPVLLPMVQQALLLTRNVWNPEIVQKHTRAMTDAILDKLLPLTSENSDERGFVLITRQRSHRSGHILGLRLKLTNVPLLQLGGALSEVHHSSSYSSSSVGETSELELQLLSSICADLKAMGVHISVRGGWLRVSPHLHTGLRHVNAFVAALIQCTVRRVQQVTSSPQQQQLQSNTASAPPTFPMSNLISPQMGGEAEQQQQQQQHQKKRPFRILITGAVGWLGQFVFESLLSSPEVLQGSVEVYAAYRTHAPHWVLPERRVALDLTCAASARAAVASVLPDALVHCAAMSSPAACQRDPQLAYATNCPLLLLDALASEVPHSCVVFTSTDMVYDGETSPYQAESFNMDESGSSNSQQLHEQKLPRPANVYGATKLAFEYALLGCLPHSYALRLSNMIGPACVYRAAGTKFLQFLEGARVQRQRVGLKAREVRSFVFVQDVVDLALALIRRHLHQHYHHHHHHHHHYHHHHIGEQPPQLADAPPADIPRILNVGGPAPLSRLGLAQSLCEYRGTDMHVAASAAELDRDDHLVDSSSRHIVAVGEQQKSCGWNIYIMDSDAPSHLPHADQGGFVSGQSGSIATADSIRSLFSSLISPRDITMDSRATEAAVPGLRFHSVLEALPKCF